MELKDISDLLDAKLYPIIERLDSLEIKVDSLQIKVDSLQIKVDSLQIKVDSLQKDMTNVLSFVSTGNEDITKQLKALKKVVH